MENSVVIGYGMVGQATAHAFGIDKYISKHEANVTYEEASHLRYHFICLPTPTINKVCFTDDIKAYIRQILQCRGGQNIFIIRSTVLPGTCRAISEEFRTRALVSNPEFLSEDTWKEDVEHPDIVVLGGDSQDYLRDVEALYKARYKSYSEIVTTDTVTAETIKYGVNCLYSLKVIYANELYENCRKTGANYETVKDTLYKRKWVGKNHLDVWYKGKRGLRGKCLPKDLEAFAEFSKGTLLTTAFKLNDIYLKESND